jgi:hypothetical protein
MQYLTFISHYDIDVLLNSSVPNKESTDLQFRVEETINKLKTILDLHPGVNEISMPIIFQNETYHITLQH